MLSRQGSEATTAKTTSTKSKPWKEVNDDIAARMMAASSDSPPLIPKRDYEDTTPSFVHRRNQSKSKPPASYNTTSDCSSMGDDCKNLIDTNRKTANNNNVDQQVALRGQHFGGYPDSGYFDSTMMMPPLFPMHPQFYGSEPFPFPPMGPTGHPLYGPPPPHMMQPPFEDAGPMAMPMMGPPFMPPPMMPPIDFEGFTYEKQKKLAKKRRKAKRRSHSLEFLSHPPPPMPFFMGQQQPFYPPVPPPMMMPPFMAGGPTNGGGGGPLLALEMGPAGQQQLFDQMPVPYPTEQPNFDVPPVSNYPIMADGFEQGEKIRPHHLQYDNEPTMIIGDNMKEKANNNDEFLRDKNKKNEKSFDYASCCRNFSQVLWIILSIMLVGLISGLILGLTLV